MHPVPAHGARRRRALLAASLVATSLALVIAVGWLWLRQSLPAYSGQRAVPGVARPLKLIRDAHAIPHIYAESDADAAFGLGYAHAQDRLWQLELSRRLGSGTLSEIFGPDTLEQDRLFRGLRLRAVARESLAVLDDATLRALRGYARGVNAFLADKPHLPLEFELFGDEPEPWDPVDSLVCLKLMGWMMSGNWADELARVRLLNRLSAQQVTELLGSEPVPSVDLRQLYGHLDRAVSSMLAVAPHRPGLRAGSNNWALDGSRTESGKPLLANDPHLSLSAPAVFYLAHLNAPGLNVIGATLPGLPGVTLGRNDRVAWAFTNTESDTQDLFIERLDPADASRYLTPRGWESFREFREVIRQRGAPDDVLIVRESRHGPIISDFVTKARQALPADRVLALSWSGRRADDKTLQFSIKAARAHSAAELKEAARDFHAPQQNIVYADTDGAIGFIAAGDSPTRRPENELRGMVPAPGWLEQYDWTGTIPFEELPQSGPGAAQLITANQDIRPPHYPYWMGSEWALPLRAQRIEALLDAVPRHSLESFQRAQLDVRSGVAEQLLPYLLRVTPKTDEQRSSLRRLAAWNFEMRRDSAEPLLFAAWLRELTRLLYADELGDAFPWQWAESPALVRAAFAQQGGAERWCDDVRTPAVEPCEALAAHALELALAYLHETYGAPERWRWGAAHRSRAGNATLGQLPWLGRWFDIDSEAAGDNETVNVSGYSIGASEPFTSNYGPTFRAVYDLASPERSVFVLSSGESGQFLSKHYSDLAALWRDGRYVPMITQRESVEKDAIGTLELSPR